jgi:hypothetical protein
MAMVASHMVWLLRTRAIRQQAKEADQTFDEFEECIQWQAKGIDLETKFLSLFAKGSPPQDSASCISDATDTASVPEHLSPKTVPNAMV